MKALVLERNLPRFAASRVASRASARAAGAGIGPLQLLDAEPPELPGADWFHLRPLLSGICGSDLATLDGRSSRYFEDMVSFPFVPGHEVVGVLDAGGIDHAGAPLAPGTRAVIEPVLGCAPRHIRPAVPPVRDRAHRPVRQRGLRRPRARPPDRLLRRHRRRLVHRRPGRPRLPAPRRARRPSPTRTP